MFVDSGIWIWRAVLTFITLAIAWQVLKIEHRMRRLEERTPCPRCGKSLEDIQEERCVF